MNDYRAYVMCDYCSIYHFGTDGMKWGKRRYQNEDGSYKPGAEGRYYDPVGDGKMSRRERKNRDIINAASEKAKRFEGYAKENSKKYGNSKRYKVENEASKKQAAHYSQLSKRYSEMMKDPKNVDRKTLREMKKFNKKGTFEDADYTTYKDPKTGKKQSYLNDEKHDDNRVKRFLSSHKGEIAIGAAAAASIIAGVALYKVSTRKKTNVVKDISDTVKRIDIPKTDIPKATVDKVNPFKVSPNSTKAAAEAVKKTAQNVGQHTNARTVAKGAENLAKATKEQQTEAQKIIDAVDSGSDYVNQLLKENEEMLKKIRGGK